VEDNDATIVPDFKNISKEEIREQIIGLSENNYTAILDSVIDI
jgi:hypothetical protein